MTPSHTHLSPLVLYDNSLWGWAIARGSPSLEICLRVDGKTIAKEITGKVLPAQLLKKWKDAPRTLCGFSFALPEILSDGFEHEVLGVMTIDGEERFSPILYWQGKDLRGEVRQLGADVVGSVWLKNRPIKKLMLRIADASGKLLSSQRLDPLKTPETLGYPAHFSIPLSTFGRQQLHIDCDGTPLRGSPFFAATSLRGHVEIIGEQRIEGWAINMIDPMLPVELALRVDGKVHCLFYPNLLRKDLAELISLPADASYLFGFALLAPLAVFDGRPHLLEIISAETGELLGNGHHRIVWQSVGKRYLPTLPPQKKSTKPRFLPPQVSVIILNRNGEALLESLLSCWHKHNQRVPAELIVIDHNSTDKSLAVLKSWQDRLDLHVIPLPRNDSFSASCNRGAKLARSQNLLFLNNDILWLHDALPSLLDSLANPSVGIVGMKLIKATPSSYRPLHQTDEVLHLGVRFKLTPMLDSCYLPFEADPYSHGDEQQFSAQEAPAVTAAALLCRKQDFDAIGGFDSAYFYGYEDVEFCLRLSQKLTKQVISRNDCVALHYQGHTRLSGREPSVLKRLLGNVAVLETQIGLWLKGAWWQSLLAGDGYYTKERLTIGLIGDAIALAPALSIANPAADVFLLQPTDNWKHVRNFHILVVGDTDYDIRSLQDARKDLQCLAYVTDSPATWASLPWWQLFEGVVVPQKLLPEYSKKLQHQCMASSPAAPLGLVLDPTHRRIRAVIVANPTKKNEQKSALALQRQLRSSGVSCWVVGDISGGPWIYEVCITLTSSQKKRIASTLERGIVRVECPLHMPAPTTQWLKTELERHLGSTFLAS